MSNDPSVYYLLVPAIIGSIIGVCGAYMVKLVYRYKGTPRVDIVRFFACVSMSIIAPIGLYIVKNSAANEDDLLQLVIFFVTFVICFFSIMIYMKRQQKSEVNKDC